MNHYHGVMQLLENRVGAQSGNWLKIRLIGKKNRDAIGAKVTVTLPDGHKLWKENHSTIGYLSGHPKVMHFGVRHAKRVVIGITWPDGMETKHEVESNRNFTISQY